MRTALLRLAWDEADRPEDERIETEGPESDAELFAFHRRDIDEAVSADYRKDHFGQERLDDHVARLALRLGYAPEAIVRWRDLPDPPDAALDFELDEAPDEEPAEGERRSSG